MTLVGGSIALAKDLCCNQLSGAIPSWLGSLGSLRYLRLHDYQLTEPFPASLTTLSLQRLSLDICVPPLYQDWVATISDFRGTVCEALPHVPGSTPPWPSGWGAARRRGR